MQKYPPGLYLVTPDWNDTDKLLAATEAALRGGAVAVQYRHKTASFELRCQQASLLQECCASYRVPFFVNDHCQLALDVAADGLHLGRTDGNLADARSRLKPEQWLGISCYDRLDLAHQASHHGANYVAFGAMYPSRTKPRAVRASIDLIAQASRELHIPVACIGGIAIDNARSLIAAGAHWLAVITDIYACREPQAQAARYAELFDIFYCERNSCLQMKRCLRVLSKRSLAGSILRCGLFAR